MSRATPLDSFKLKKNGFHALHVLNSPLAKKGRYILDKNLLNIQTHEPENPCTTAFISHKYG